MNQPKFSDYRKIFKSHPRGLINCSVFLSLSKNKISDIRCFCDYRLKGVTILANQETVCVKNTIAERIALHCRFVCDSLLKDFAKK